MEHTVLKANLFLNKFCKSFVKIWKRVCVYLCGGIYREIIRVVMLRISNGFVIKPKRYNKVCLISALISTIPTTPFFRTLWDTSANNALFAERKSSHIMCEREHLMLSGVWWEWCGGPWSGCQLCKWHIFLYLIGISYLPGTLTNYVLRAFS